VYLEYVSNGKKAVWLDGGLPSRRALLRQDVYDELVDTGFDVAVLAKYGLNEHKKRYKKSTESLHLDLLSLYVENHLKDTGMPGAHYQIVLMKPQWDHSNEPKAVRLARKAVFHPGPNQTPEDDPLFEAIPYEDILHVRPHIYRLPAEKFYQTLVVRPLTDEEPAYDPVRQYVFSFPPHDVDAPRYRNYPMLSKALNNLLQELLTEELELVDLSRILSGKCFIIVAHRVPLNRKTTESSKSVG
jgi:hypothetical protein